MEKRLERSMDDIVGVKGGNARRKRASGRTLSRLGASRNVIGSRARTLVIAAVGPVRGPVDLGLETVEHGADYRRAGRLQLFLGPPYLVQIGVPGADDQKHRIDDARKEQRVIGRQNRG